MNIIEQLKNNEKPFGLMSAEMQEKVREIGKSGNFDWYCGPKWIRQNNSAGFGWGAAYRLRPDYVDEPEIVECEIYESLDGRLMYRESVVGRRLSTAMNNPNFIGFKFKDGHVAAFPIRYEKDGGVMFTPSLKYLKSSTTTVLHATHVCFRGPK